MIRDKYTFFGHAGMDHCNPVSRDAMEEIVSDLGLPRGRSALDVGCGKAELLIRLAEVHGARGVGIDRSPLMVAEAQRRIGARAPGLVEIREMDAADLRVEPGSLDFAACVGASSSLGGTVPALKSMAGWVRPGGLVLIGEGFWARLPPPAFLDATGIQPAEMTDHAGNLAAGAQAGLTVVRTAPTGQDDWDRYERSHGAAIEGYASEHPDDPDTPGLLARSRAWRAATQQWGWGVLGFALYLFRRP